MLAGQTEEKGYFASYKSFATTLRTWFVGYGIGAPVLFASQDAFARLLLQPKIAATIIVIFLAGVVTQVMSTLLFKICMWYLYVAEWKPEFKSTKRYKISYALSDNIWLELLFDVLSIGAFAWATFLVLSEFVAPASKVG